MSDFAERCPVCESNYYTPVGHCTQGCFAWRMSADQRNLLVAFAAILRHDGATTARDHVANAAVLAVKAWMQMEDGK